MTRTGNTGIVVTNVSGCFHNNFFKINYNKELCDKLFLVTFLKRNTVHNKIIELAGGSTILDLKHKDFLNMNIILPTLEEQEKIGKYFEELDNKIELEISKLNKLKDIKNAMLNKLLP